MFSRVLLLSFVFCLYEPCQGQEPGKKGETPSAAEATLSVPDGAPALTTKGKTSRMKGLLVMALEGGKLAGSTSQMSAVAIPDAADGPAVLKFNQETGPDMEKALAEAVKFLTVKHGGWPRGCRLEISFENKYNPKDGPSAAVACALLVDSLITGEEWDPALALTGDMNADGSVQRVGGVEAKIRGAAMRNCRLAAVPAGNAGAVRDLFITDGASALLNIQVFSLAHFDDARNLALTTSRPEKLTAAMADFDALRAMAPRQDRTGGAWLRQPAAQERLRKVLAGAPNHLSARLLLDFAQGKMPAQLSLAGSLQAIGSNGAAIFSGIRSRQSGNFSSLSPDELRDAVFKLRGSRARFDPRTRPLVDRMEKFASLVRGFLQNPPRHGAAAQKGVQAIMSAASAVDQEYERLTNDPAVVEELTGK